MNKIMSKSITAAKLRAEMNIKLDKLYTAINERLFKGEFSIKCNSIKLDPHDTNLVNAVCRAEFS